MQPLHVIKIGGNSIDNPQELDVFLSDLAGIPGHKILVHGGGKLATSLAEQLHIPQTLIEGRRVTDAATLDIAVMVYSGLINKRIVAALQARGCNALGVCGADAGLIRSIRRANAAIDFGFVGDVADDGVDTQRMRMLLDAGITPVLSAITHDGSGSLLNTNADTLAASVAVAMAVQADVTLRYCFEKNGVLLDLDDNDTALPTLDPETYARLKQQGLVSKGMIPKLDNAFDAARRGVKHVIIGHAAALHHLSGNDSGTLIVHHETT